MQLDNAAIKEFQEIYNKEFGEEITEIEAEEMGGKLVNLMALIYKPIKKSNN